MMFGDVKNYIFPREKTGENSQSGFLPDEIALAISFLLISKTPHQ